MKEVIYMCDKKFYCEYHAKEENIRKEGEH